MIEFDALDPSRPYSGDDVDKYFEFATNVNNRICACGFEFAGDDRNDDPSPIKLPSD